MKFSIIIPIYNRSFFIDETLSSLLNQTYADIEIICVDDCSTDESLKKIKSYALKDKRIKVVAHSKNLGPHCARQTGVSNASGDYILFLDCDDALEVFACASLYDILSKTDYDVLEFAYRHKNTKNVSLPVPSITIDNLFDSLVYFKNPRAGTVWNKVYKKKLLQEAFSKMQSFYSVMGEDLYESIVIAYYAKSYAFINKPLVLYNDETGISNKQNDLSSVKKSLASIKADLDAFNIFFDMYAKKKTDAVVYIERQYFKYVFYIQILMNTRKMDWLNSLNLLFGCFSKDTLLTYEKKIKKTILGLRLELVKYKINNHLRRLMPYKLKKNSKGYLCELLYLIWNIILKEKKYMQDILKGIPIDYEFFPAVYGKSITNIEQFYDSKLAEKKAKRQLNVGEIGTAISHKNIYKKMIDENIEQALILEDDVTFLDGFIDVYKKIEKINVGNKIILLGTIVKKKIKKIWKKKLTPEHSMYLVLNNYAGAYGYIIGLDAAKKIYYHNKKIFIEADKWKYYRRLSQIWLVSPSVVTVDEIFSL